MMLFDGFVVIGLSYYCTILYHVVSWFCVVRGQVSLFHIMLSTVMGLLRSGYLLTSSYCGMVACCERSIILQYILMISYFLTCSILSLKLNTTTISRPGDVEIICHGALLQGVQMRPGSHGVPCAPRTNRKI